jgi:hypothetical protein
MNSSLQSLTALLQNQWHHSVSVWAQLDSPIEGFIYYYPLFMAYIWMFGAIIFISVMSGINRVTMNTCLN